MIGKFESMAIAEAQELSSQDTTELSKVFEASVPKIDEI
ncbi:MAG: hypothetical protein ACI8T1_003117 [Verrucomicrobiales bacterium]|jgi:hypothetical protein